MEIHCALILITDERLSPLNFPRRISFEMESESGELSCADVLCTISNEN